MIATLRDAILGMAVVSGPPCPGGEVRLRGDVTDGCRSGNEVDVIPPAA